MKNSRIFSLYVLSLLILSFLSQCRIKNVIECGRLSNCDEKAAKTALFSILTAQPYIEGVFIPAVNASGASDDAATYQTAYTLSDTAWDETAVRKVLLTFAYGGPASDAQITTWADMSPSAAIIEMLSMTVDNTKLARALDGNNPTEISYSERSLSGLSKIFTAGRYTNSPSNYNQMIRYGNAPGYSFLGAVRLRGLNPFRFKVGMIETNYHMSINLDKNVDSPQMLQYFDDIVNDIAGGYEYHVVLRNAALSAAVATQYNHRKNVIQNATFRGNEDFAREYHQLYFGILGTGVNGDCGKLSTDTCSGNPENFYNHELKTIRQTAEALTDIQVLDKGQFKDTVAVYGSTYHQTGELSIYNQNISGNNARERFTAISPNSISHPESLQNLPVILVRFYADENLDPSNPIVGTTDEIHAKLATIRALWKDMSNKNLIEFLRKYAVSTAFHNSTRVKYRTSIDRILTIVNLVTTSNTEASTELLSPFSRLRNETVIPFRPEHDVFGGQTGIEAAESDDVFTLQYNSARSNRYGTSSYWNGSTNVESKDFRKLFSQSSKLSSKTENFPVSDVAEFLWIRFTGDANLKHFGILEKAHIYALLATGTDFMFQTDETCKTSTWDCKNTSINSMVITEAQLNDSTSAIGNLYRSFASDLMYKTGESTTNNQDDNARIGYAIDFIISTPFMFVQEGL
ncbi:MAG: hypothetical protein H7A25_12505 [Leptospiraceae bacterium]|nr:hypothetical protein [Leptospiraceae bacterium]MCP5500720.1 hypothetical protein [Leptospiraceae bacterium]